jgi:hypothetical protein
MLSYLHRVDVFLSASSNNFVYERTSLYCTDFDFDLDLQVAAAGLDSARARMAGANGKKIAQLCEMGCTRAAAKSALKACKWDVSEV